MNKVIKGDFFYEVEGLDENSFDLIICDGPYNATNCSEDWDTVENIQKYNENLLSIFSRKLTQGGSLYLFGKHDAIDFIDYSIYLQLNNRIIWMIESRLRQGKKRYTNNYDVIFFFSKGEPKTFNLDDIRIPQSTQYKSSVESAPSVKSGKYKDTKYNPLGKNPGDFWNDIKALTYKSQELIDQKLHTIQKPEKLIERMILASSNKEDLVLDSFSGTGTVSAVAKKLNRNSIAIENDEEMYYICNNRLFLNPKPVMENFL